MIKKLALLTVSLALLVCCASLIAETSEKAAGKDVRVLVKTNKGDITMQVYASKTPVTAANFLNLARRGYYNNVVFHRVIPNFMVQTGDPTGTGMGTPGYAFDDECLPSLKHDSAGILSMARTARPNTNGSQFFITHRATPHLDGQHTVFGKVLKGQDVVNSIEQGDKIEKIEFIDSPDEALKAQESKVTEWNKILDKNNNKAVLPQMQ